MPDVEVAGFPIPNWRHGGTVVKLRLYSSENWTDFDGVPHLAGIPGSTTGFYQEVIGTVTGANAAIPTFSTPATRNSPDYRLVRITGVLFDEKDTVVEPFLFDSWVIPNITPTAWLDLAVYNSSPQAPLADHFVTIDGLLALLAQGSTGGTVPPSRGGTGHSVYVIGDLLYASAPQALARLAAVATGNALISQGVGVPPVWGKIDLTQHVIGVLPPGNGGGAPNPTANVLPVSRGGVFVDSFFRDTGIYATVAGAGFEGLTLGSTNAPQELLDLYTAGGSGSIQFHLPVDAFMGLVWKSLLTGGQQAYLIGNITGDYVRLLSEAKGANATYFAGVIQNIVRNNGNTEGCEFLLRADAAYSYASLVRNNGNFRGLIVGLSGVLPDATTVLHLESTTGALLLPRLTNAQQAAVALANGKILYNAEAHKFRGVANGVWVDLQGSGGGGSGLDFNPIRWAYRTDSMTIMFNALLRSGSGSAARAGARHVEGAVFAEGSRVGWRALVTTGVGCEVGFDPTSNYASGHPLWGWGLLSTAMAWTIENGSLVTNDGAFVEHDFFEVEIAVGSFKYYKNGVLKKTVAGTTSGTFYFMCVMRDTGPAGNGVLYEAQIIS